MRRTPLRKMGRDKQRETAKYWPLRKAFLEKYPFCEFPSHLEVHRSTQIHHMKGQHWKIMNDTKYWLGVCSEHHAWIEDNKREARKRGLILYK